ncbi:superfamily I DNA and/or RNA helicase [Flavobacterium croceum DSM 17960]|uniref:Superfamily I DNA and/or RNA helicase n=1 Tax=Flavobacterium croceum DSM 17960 TaxID=1121886 RepID=A0A2S4N4I9_9FLAO|nr:AAA domain-containing protein [Flavobacterium croceum]POS00654.1 superfamily I DNA and/or RNA helicase [Flavobacterium croceum DSM 17960]
MNVLNQYITFLKEYKKLLERGVKDVLNSTVSSNFIWIDEIENFIESGICESTLIDIFSPKFKKQPLVFSLQKPNKPNIQIPNRFIEIIEFDEAKNKFESISGNEEELISFQNSVEGKVEIEKLKRFKKEKEIHSKLFNSYDDIKFDSNLEIVLSIGLIQYSKQDNRGNLSKTNQHLFHFPLSVEIGAKNIVKISFSESESPYPDFFFLNNNNAVIKQNLSNVIDAFEREIQNFGYGYIFEKDFKDLIVKSIQKISSNSEFENSVYKPASDHFREDYFKISFSPAINIKYRKPRFFEKLTDSIIKHNDENKIEAKLFNLLVRNPESSGNNFYTKPNYFKDELFETYKDKAKNLNGEEDFSVFFPLPFNKEQKQIYENYLKNRLTVVTGPPGTGKSHTIVNILCSLLAQGKRVLVTAQTDKALESLLNKIPETFDSLIFTKIELENLGKDGKKRFSLENSIGNISKILTDNFYLNVETKIEELDNLKAEYVKLKSEIIRALEKEYLKYNLNDTFKDLRAYQIVEKFESKESEEWNWIKDELTSEAISNFDVIKDEILKYKQLVGTEIRYNNVVNIDISTILKNLEDFDFKNFLIIKEQYINQLNYLGLNEYSKDKVLKIQLENITKIANEFSNSDIVLKNIKELENLQKQLNNRFTQENITINKSFSNLTENGTKYLLDIETYLSFAENGKAGFFTKLTNSNFKQVSYLEQFTVNGKKCNTKTEILQLKSAIENLVIISKNFTLLKQNGFSLSYDDSSNLYEKSLVLNEVLKKIEINKEVVSKIQFNADFINFSEYTQINLFDIDNLSKKAISFKDDINKLARINHQLIEKLGVLNNIDSLIEQSSLKDEFSKFLPVEKNEDVQDFELLKNKFLEIGKQLEVEQTFLNLKKYLRDLLPNTFDSLENIPNHYISKENFEYASAYRFIKENEFIDLQKCKEELSFINKKIFQVKCEILFDLAKSNFKNKFDNYEIDAFINLLNSYKFDYSQSLKKGIKDNAKFQIAIRKKGSQISKNLSCWVMKFNDVLNSLEHEPEIFDCIIVDEASQLNFNSVLLGYYSENIIIVGDSKQTSPDASMVDSNSFNHIKDKFLKDFLKDDIIQIRPDTSLFDLAKMVAGRSDLLLREHFRCVPEIIEFSKREFYDNSLRPLKQINSNRLNPKETIFVNDAFTEDKIVYKEIEEIKKFLQRILKDEQYSNKTIGVVSLGLTKHTEKLKDIKEDLANEFGKEKIDKHKLIIEDSPKFQGDERDVMIVSLGVALDFQKLKENQNAKPRAIISDQDEFKKINVALSRAKEQMILFHSVEHNDLQTNDFRNKILSFFKDEAKPISQLQIDNNNIERYRHNVPEPFDSWFECDIAKALIENGYSYIQPQYNVKEAELFYNHKLGKQVYINFKIDLVVHNNGKMIAIECDGDPFHSLPEDVAYDIERQEFLERVGWKVYRVLYSAFKRSPQEETQKIIDFIEKNTKKDHKITIEKPIELKEEFEDEIEFENEEEISEYVIPKHKSYIDILEENTETSDSINQLNGTTATNHKHKSFIDMIEEDLEESNQVNLFSYDSKILCYFNLFSDNTYKVQEHSEENCLFSLPIDEKFKDGFLLQCYDNGHINKVYVNSILEKRMNYHYSNGKNPNANILYLKLIEEDAIIALKIKRGLETVFKAHKTENISNRELLHLQGYKVVYQTTENIEYKILPKNIYEGIRRLVFTSFTAEGKSVHNNYYENEWKIIEQFIPKLTE